MTDKKAGCDAAKGFAATAHTHTPHNNVDSIAYDKVKLLEKSKKVKKSPESRMRPGGRVKNYVSFNRQYFESDEFLALPPQIQAAAMRCMMIADEKGRIILKATKTTFKSLLSKKLGTGSAHINRMALMGFFVCSGGEYVYRLGNSAFCCVKIAPLQKDFCRRLVDRERKSIRRSKIQNEGDKSTQSGKSSANPSPEPISQGSTCARAVLINTNINNKYNTNTNYSTIQHDPVRLSRMVNSEGEVVSLKQDEYQNATQANSAGGRIQPRQGGFKASDNAYCCRVDEFETIKPYEGYHSGIGKPKISAACHDVSTPDIAKLVETWDKLAAGKGASRFMPSSKPALDRHLRQHGLKAMQWAMVAYFANQSEFCTKNKWPIGGLLKLIDSYVDQGRGLKAKAEDAKKREESQAQAAAKEKAEKQRRAQQDREEDRYVMDVAQSNGFVDKAGKFLVPQDELFAAINRGKMRDVTKGLLFSESPGLAGEIAELKRRHRQS